MIAADLIKRFDVAKQVSAALAIDIIPNRPGYYSIWIDDPNNLPQLYADWLRVNETELIYVGIATTSLLRRVVEQDLQHKSPSTFFRGIGPILGYRPGKGSLVGRSNQNNYRFSKEDTVSIIGWIENHLSVRVVEESPASANTEADVIRDLCPLLNTAHNPDALRELSQLRRECREIARATA